MATTKPAVPGKPNLDAGTDDVAQARSDLVSHVDTTAALINALGALALLDLHATAPGLEAIAQGAQIPDRLRLKLQAAAGLLLEGAGVRLDLAGLPGPQSAALAADDKIAVLDQSASGHKHAGWTWGSALASIAGTGLEASGAKLNALVQTTGPTLIDGPNAVGSGSSHDNQAAGIAGLNAWRLAFSTISGNNTAARLQLQVYDGGALVTSGYTWVRGGSSGVGDTRVDMTGGLAAGGAHWTGECDVWLAANGDLLFEWSIHRSTGQHDLGRARLAGVGAVTGFRIFVTDGVFDLGTLAAYKLPQWTHA